MTYGVYTKDLRCYSVTGHALETARKYCGGDHVVCEERDHIHGFELRVLWHKWHFQLLPRWQIVHLGFISIGWSVLKCKVPVRIVEEGGEG